jgi:hypothetical protein
MVPALAPILRGEERPAWLSEPLVVVPPLQDADDADGQVPLPRAALYAVCLEPGDDRCAT